MKGVAATVSGTVAAHRPMEVPAMRRVNGMMATTRMMKGVERVALTTRPRMPLSHGAASNSPRRLVARKIPSGKPNRVPRQAATATMARVSPVAWSSRRVISGDTASLHAANRQIAEEIGDETVGVEERTCAPDDIRPRGQAHRQ